MTSPLHIARFVAPDAIVRSEAIGRAVRVMQRFGIAALGGDRTTT